MSTTLNLSIPSKVSQTLSDRPRLRSFVSGSVSATCSTILFQPFDLVKTRIQRDDLTTRAGRSKVMTIVSHVVEKDRVSGLWKGTCPSLVRTVPGIGLYFMSVDFLKTNFVGTSRSPSAIEAGTIGVTARCIAGIILLPVTVLKTRYESGQFNYSGLGHALTDTYSREGLRGLFRGCAPTLLRDAPYSGLYFMFYSQLKDIVSVPNDLKTPIRSRSTTDQTMVTFSCGLSAGILASLVTQPFDVVKTKMQLDGGQYRSLLRAAVIIVNKKGLTGFFDGMTPRILRRSLMSAISWTFFETVTKAFNGRSG